MISVLVADNLPLKLTEQEQAVRNSLIEIAELKDVQLISVRNSNSTATRSMIKSLRCDIATFNLQNM